MISKTKYVSRFVTTLFDVRIIALEEKYTI